jgi:tRNA pseudouridine55 synthase
MKFDFENGEILLINKPYEWTSFDVVSSVRYAVKRYTANKKIKVGHAGTLDPLATGLLIVCTGKYTKKIESIQGLEKEYTGTFTLGATTPSYDKETEVDNNFDISHINNDVIIDATQHFIGKIMQVPPLHSAVWIEGKRAYEYARNNEKVKVEAKAVEIKSFEILDIDLPDVAFKVVCSKGTYIRSLARDLGEKLKCGAYLSSLCRTRIGDFRIEDSLEPSVFKGILAGE